MTSPVPTATSQASDTLTLEDINQLHLPETRAGIYFFFPAIALVGCKHYFQDVLMSTIGFWPTIVLAVTIIIYWLYKVRRIARGGVCKCGDVLDVMEDHVVVITGGSRGVGGALALEMAKLHARVYVLCRSSPPRHPNIRHVMCDLSSIWSVKLAALAVLREETKIDVLVNNAAIQGLPLTKGKDGFEAHFTVNFLSHYYLTTQLRPAIIEARGRVLNVTCFAHTWVNEGIDLAADMNHHDYDCHHAFGQSKLALIMHAYRLQREFDDLQTGCLAVSVDPGSVNTSIDQDVSKCSRWLSSPITWLLRKSPYEGMQTLKHCCIYPQLDGGVYYKDCKPSYSSVAADNEKDSDDLLKLSQAMVENALRRHRSQKYRPPNIDDLD